MNIRMKLKFDWDGEEWTKEVGTSQPREHDLIQDDDLEWMVKRVTHFTNANPMLVEVTEINLKTSLNIHWELGHERGWKLTQ